MSTLLEDLTSKDPTRIWSASSAVVHLRDPQELDRLAHGIAEIRRTTKGVALGGALFPNAERLRFVLRKLKYHRDRVGCLCQLYPEYLMYDPHKEAAAGNIRIEISSMRTATGWTLTSAFARSAAHATESRNASIIIRGGAGRL